MPGPKALASPHYGGNNFLDQFSCIERLFGGGTIIAIFALFGSALFAKIFEQKLTSA